MIFVNLISDVCFKGGIIICQNNVWPVNMKMIAGDYYRPADLNHGLAKAFGRNKRPLTKK